MPQKPWLIENESLHIVAKHNNRQRLSMLLNIIFKFYVTHYGRELKKVKKTGIVCSMWSDFNHHHCSNCQSLKILLYCTARSLSHIDAKLYVYIHLLHTAPTISIVFWRRVEKYTDKDHNDTQFCVSLWLDCIIITVYLFSIFAIISMSARPLPSLCYGFLWNEKKSYFCYKRIAVWEYFNSYFEQNIIKTLESLIFTAS